jgi:fatty acid synthase, animal type
MNRVKVEDFDIEFEDVKFLRATTLAKNQEIDFIVVIHKGTGRFEINEGVNALVTGFVKVATEKLTEVESPKDNCPVLPTRDFYKELRLRGYHYNGLFRSIVEVRSDGQGGKIKWASNWIAFLDCLLQVQIIAKDTRSLMLPTGIRKIVIKPREHEAFINAITDEEKIMNVESCKILNVLRCGGVEMRGLQASLVNRRRPPGIPVLETYQFIPHLTAPGLNKSNLARFCVQLALENVPAAKYLIVEVDGNDEKEPLCTFFDQALGDLPLVTGEINYLTTQSIELEKVVVQDSSITSFTSINFVIASALLSNIQMLASFTAQVVEGAFIVSREKKSSDFKFPKTLPNGYQIVAIIPINDELIVLLQYFNIKPVAVSKVIKVTSQNYDWLDELKQSVQAGSVLAYSEKEELSGIIGLVNCIRKEPNGLNLKCVFIDDHRAPAFDIEHQFYKSHLQQGLAINVFKNGQWGSYKHLLLQQEITHVPQTGHCYANVLTRGDLSSMTWLEGPFNYGKPKGKMVKVQYAALNFRDVMLATGKISVETTGSDRLDQLCVLGLEYSGVTEDNKRVMGMILSGAMASHVQTDEVLYWTIPDEWTLEEAVTIPCIYGTVYSAFFLTAQIEKGKKILIHAGSGGIGLAAIRVAFAYGLEVFTTVSTEEKKNYLLNEYPQLKAENIGNSRDTSFEDMVMSRTDGKGVDYVLNSLADEKLQASIRCLGKGGRFMEIGKFDMANDTKIGLGNFLKELSFHSIMVDTLFAAPVAEKEVKMEFNKFSLKMNYTQSRFV